MENEKSRAEQEQQAISDAQQGMLPDPNGGQYYYSAYNNYKSQNAPPQDQQQ
jgi:hypothetical protein